MVGDFLVFTTLIAFKEDFPDVRSFAKSFYIFENRFITQSRQTGSTAKRFVRINLQGHDLLGDAEMMITPSLGKENRVERCIIVTIGN